MQSNSSFNVVPDYKGSRHIVVPVKMYSKKSILKALHVKSKRWLGIDLDRYILSFHKTRGDVDPSEEVHFSRIRSVDADMSKSDMNKYYLSVLTDNHQYSFKFKNVRDFYNVVEALRHTLHNNQPVFVTREDFVKLASLHQNTIMHTQSNLHQDTAHIDISSDDEADFDRRHANTVPVPIAVPVVVGTVDPTANIATQGIAMNQQPPKPMTIQNTTTEIPRHVSFQNPEAAVTTTVTETTERVETHMESPAMQQVHSKGMTEEEYQYLKWKYQDRNQQDQSVIPAQFKSFVERDDDPHGQLVEKRQAFESFHAQYQQALKPVVMAQPIVQSQTIVTTAGQGGLRANSEIMTSTTTTFTNPGYVAGQIAMTESEWRGMERQLIEQEKLVLLKNEELKAREAALHAYKIELKQQEIMARADVMAKKEAELAALEAEIKSIQTGITTIQNKAQAYQQDVNAYNQSLQAQKNISLGFVPHKQPETISVTVEETNVVEEKIQQQMPVIETEQMVQAPIPIIVSNQFVRM